MKWDKRTKKIKYFMAVPPSEMLTEVFYPSSYACPHCGRSMFKTVFPVGGEFPIDVSDGTRFQMKRVFTCPPCKYFVTAAKDKLIEGKVYELQCHSVQEYMMELYAMDCLGTTMGRND